MLDAIVMAATGVQTATEAHAALLAGRRPRASRMWRLRVPESLDDQARKYAAPHGRTLSEVTREAVAAYITSPVPEPA